MRTRTDGGALDNLHEYRHLGLTGLDEGFHTARGKI